MIAFLQLKEKKMNLFIGLLAYEKKYWENYYIKEKKDFLLFISAY